jgi:hypothetical protein
VYLSRSCLKDRVGMMAAKGGCSNEELHSAMSPIALGDTEKLHLWSVEDRKVETSATLLDLVFRIKQTKMARCNLLDDMLASTNTSAYIIPQQLRSLQALQPSCIELLKASRISAEVRSTIQHVNTSQYTQWLLSWPCRWVRQRWQRTVWPSRWSQSSF